MGNKGDSLQGLPYGLVTYDDLPRSDWLALEIEDGIVGNGLWNLVAPLHLLGTPSQVSKTDSLLYYHDLFEKGMFGIDGSYAQEGSLYENSFLTQEQIHEGEKLVENNPFKEQILHGKFVWGTMNIFAPPNIEAAQDDARMHGDIKTGISTL